MEPTAKEQMIFDTAYRLGLVHGIEQVYMALTSGDEDFEFSPEAIAERLDQLIAAARKAL